jgi:two-component system nitrate/nitrite response regulator NarL
VECVGGTHAHAGPVRDYRLAAREGGPMSEGLRVLVAGGSEVLRQGLHTMVGALPIVREVSLDEGTPADVVIMSPPLPAIPLPHNAKLLVVLPDGAGPPDLPVDGVLLESELTSAALADALGRIRAGQIPMPARLARELLDRTRRPKARVLLTPREWRTLALLADGLSNKQIARRLAVSEHAAKRAVAAVLAKLNCANRALAVAVALREGLLDPHQDP